MVFPPWVVVGVDIAGAVRRRVGDEIQVVLDTTVDCQEQITQNRGGGRPSK